MSLCGSEEVAHSSAIGAKKESSEPSAGEFSSDPISGLA